MESAVVPVEFWILKSLINEMVHKVAAGLNGENHVGL